MVGRSPFSSVTGRSARLTRSRCMCPTIRPVLTYRRPPLYVDRVKGVTHRTSDRPRVRGPTRIHGRFIHEEEPMGELHPEVERALIKVASTGTTGTTARDVALAMGKGPNGGAD